MKGAHHSTYNPAHERPEKVNGDNDGEGHHATHHLTYQHQERATKHEQNDEYGHDTFLLRFYLIDFIISL
jgi:hypothetical protein